MATLLSCHDSKSLSDNGNTVTLSFPAFQSRNYRLYFAGQSISLIGTWMTRLATSWLVYRLTGSAFLLGLVGFMIVYLLVVAQSSTKQFIYFQF